MQEDKKNIVKIITSMGGKYSPDMIFSDWVECCALTIVNACDIFQGKVWEKREEQYKRIIEKYTPEERQKMVEMTCLLSGAMDGEVTDILGEIYMESGCGSKQTGQFFTPYHLSKAIADVMTQEDISEENKLELYEPSCGAGGMIIAKAAALNERGINFQRCMRVVAQDLDWRGVYMTYVQLSLMGIDAIVVQGNTLTEPYKRGYPRERVFRTPKNVGMLL